VSRTRITLNGRVYDGPESMPPEARRRYEDILRRASLAVAQGEAGRSVASGQGSHEAPTSVNLRVRDQIILNGQEYAGAEAMPPAAREQYESALRLTRGGRGLHVSHDGASVTVRLSHGDELGGVGSGRPTGSGSRSLESTLRTLFFVLAATVATALVLWGLLGR